MKYENPILEKKEYVLLKRLMNLTAPNMGVVEKNAIKRLNEELTMALICDEQDMPSDVVRFNSMVTVHAGDWKKAFTLVPPSQSDSSNAKISIMSLMGMVLIGYAKGDCIRWEFPDGVKDLVIAEVKQSDTPIVTSVLI